MTDERVVVGLLRELAPQVVGVLARRYGDWSAAEDATQEALLAASTAWSTDGIPDHPRSWLITVASRRVIDSLRSDIARREREYSVAALEVATAVPGDDDSLTLLYLCCHPALSQPSQLALTLRAVGGLTTAEIARAFLVPESTVAQRISRAKQQIRAAGLRFEPPPAHDLDARLAVVLQVLYLIFNEGYTPGSRSVAAGADLTDEAIRIARMLRASLPADGEVAGLLALMLLTDARRAARELPDGMLVPLAEQDRRLWNAALIAEGTALLTATLGSVAVGPYQLQAAIAALHDEAATPDDTDWPQILALYTVLERIAPGPVVTLNRAVAVAMVDGPLAGLALLGTIAGEAGLAHTHRFDVVRGHLLELAGDAVGAVEAYGTAMRGTVSVAERRYLALKVARLAAG
ncbi:RNA polymerase sigma factor [Conyzicola sp.]|uniref:RNA polymerase sigma factor n=1 Tax=Conyzicola sp. TaxID=1969404 RepID=UPI0039894D9C